MIKPEIIVIAVLWNSIFLVHGSFYLQQPGEFIIGQVLSLHKSSDTSKCVELDLEKIIEVEALVYSANKINSENKDFRIGYDIVDACSVSKSEPQAQLDFATRAWFENENNISRIPVAVITDLSHRSDFFFVANKVRLFTDQSPNGLPLISVKHRDHVWGNTYSMDPDQSTPQRAIAELAKYFQWNILDALIYKEYHQFQNFKKTNPIKDKNICLLKELFVSDDFSPFCNHSMASVTVLFSAEAEFPRLMSELDRCNLSGRNFMLGSEMVGTQDLWADSMRGLLGIRRDSGNLENFEQHLRTSNLLEEAIKNSNYTGQKQDLINDLSWRGASVIDAVYAILKARKSGSNRLPKTGLTGIRSTSPTGRIVSFDSNENLDEVKYEVLNFQKRNSDVKARKVGEIEISKKTKLSIQKAEIVWRSSTQPRSRCSRDCPPGTRRKAWDDSSGKCCWDCLRCESGTVSSFTNSTRCVKCPIGSKPTVDQTKCQPPYFDYLKWHEPFSLVMIFLLAFTICFLVYAVNLYVKKAHTPVFTRSKCASLPLLLSLFITFILPILLLMKPTEISCGAYNAIFLFSLGIPLTFLISRSHVLYNYCYNEEGQLKRKWFRFNPQTVLSIILIILQLILLVIHLNIAPVKVLVFNTSEPDVEYIECSSHSRPEFLPFVFFILLLVMVFNILHMNDVSTPDNFNEVKFVSLAVYLMCTIIFVYFVAVFGIIGKKKIVTMCAMSFLLGLNFLVTIFLPKIYVILFRPEDNLPDARPLLGDGDENGNSARMVKRDCADSPLLGQRSGQYERTEV